MPAKKAAKKAEKRDKKAATDFLRPLVGKKCCGKMWDHIAADEKQRANDEEQQEAKEQQQAAKILELVSKKGKTLAEAYAEVRKTTEVNPSALAADILQVMFVEGAEPKFPATITALERLK